MSSASSTHPLTELPLGSTPPLLGGLDDLPNLIDRLQVDRAGRLAGESPDEMLTCGAPSAPATCTWASSRETSTLSARARPCTSSRARASSDPPARRSRHALAAKRRSTSGVRGRAWRWHRCSALSLLVRLDSRGPTLYRGQRIGRGGREIELRKSVRCNRMAKRGSPSC